MHPYAQTNVQLYNQLAALGYPQSGQVLVRHAYELAMVLFSARYHPCGKPLIAHHVGVASILAAEGLPAFVVAAGMLHAAYRHGDFGALSRGPAPANRRRVRSVVGEAVEEIVFAYPRVSWPPRGRSGVEFDPRALEQPLRHAYLMQIANALEDHLDLGIRYCEPFALEPYFTRDGLDEVAIECEAMGYPGLARAWREIVATAVSARVVDGMRRPTNRACTQLPDSCRPTLAARVRKLAEQSLATLRRIRRRLMGRAGSTGAPS